MEARGEYAKRAGNSYYRLSEPVPYHYLHITVTRDTNTIQEGFAGARQVEGYGYTSPPMVSYQLLTTNEGKAFEGQNYGVKGTHTVNDKKIAGFPEDLNRYGYAVALMQNVWDPVTDQQVRLVAAAFAAAELEGHVRRGAPIFPHAKFAWKECPGGAAIARIPEIQRLKDQYVASNLGGATAPVTEWDEMASKDEVKKAVIEALQEVKFPVVLPDGKTEAQRKFQWFLQRIEARDHRLADAVQNLPSAAEITEAVKGAIPQGTSAAGIDYAQVEKAVAAVLKKGTDSY